MLKRLLHLLLTRLFDSIWGLSGLLVHFDSGVFGFGCKRMWVRIPPLPLLLAKGGSGVIHTHIIDPLSLMAESNIHDVRWAQGGLGPFLKVQFYVSYGR